MLLNEIQKTGNWKKTKENMGSFDSVQLGILHTIRTINTTLNKTF